MMNPCPQPVRVQSFHDWEGSVKSLVLVSGGSWQGHLAHVEFRHLSYSKTR